MEYVKSLSDDNIANLLELLSIERSTRHAREITLLALEVQRWRGNNANKHRETQRLKDAIVRHDLRMKQLRDPNYCVVYLDAALREGGDGKYEAFRKALKEVAEAQEL